MARYIWLIAIVLLLGAPVAAHAKSAQLTGVETAAFSDREVVVIRHTGGASISPRAHTDSEAGVVTFTLRNLEAAQPKYIEARKPLITSVELTPVAAKNEVLIKVKVASADVIDAARYRFGKYSSHVILIELFPLGVKKDTAPEVRNLDDLLAGRAQKVEPNLELTPGQRVKLDAEPTRVFDHLSGRGLVGLDTRLTIINEDSNLITSEQGVNGVRQVLEEGAVGEVVFVGSPEKIARLRETLRTTRFSSSAKELDAKVRQTTRASSGSGIDPDEDYPRMRPESPPDHFSYKRLKGQLSDILVSLPATTGYNFYRTIMLLSQMSGITIVIDPYLTDPPTGSLRSNKLEPPGGGEGDGGEGFRGAGEFQSMDLHGATNTVIGNFEQVPFDTALEIILEAHNLQYIVFATPETAYTKPVILISSKERIEQEIARANEIDLYQLHYADPAEVYAVLDNMDLLPSRDKGWWVYQNRYGSGGGGGSGQGERGSGGGAGGGGAGGGGGSGGGSGGGGGGGVGPGGGTGGVMGHPLDPGTPQSVIVEFAPGTYDERIAELLALAGSKGMEVLDLSFANTAQLRDSEGRLLIVFVGK
jgi:copper(I)-binding protein